MIFGNFEVDVTKVIEALDIRIQELSDDELYCQCPFHDDRNPSFNVNIDTGLWNCFTGCGGGNLVQLVEKIENVDTLGAMSFIANFGEEMNLKEVTVTVNSNKFFSEKELMKYKGVIPKYLLDRGFDEVTLRKWEVGYDINNSLVVIPVRDENSRLRGVIYRKINNEDKPKYKYSKGLQTSKMLFGLYMYPKEGVYVLTEGSLDSIWLDQHGYKGVALLGSNMSMEQELLIRGNSDKIILCLDNDQVGSDATESIINKLWPDIMLYVVDLTPYKDIQEVPTECIREILAHKKSVLERRIAYVRGTIDSGLEGKDKDIGQQKLHNGDG